MTAGVIPAPRDPRCAEHRQVDTRAGRQLELPSAGKAESSHARGGHAQRKAGRGFGPHRREDRVHDGQRADGRHDDVDDREGLPTGEVVRPTLRNSEMISTTPPAPAIT